MKRFIIQVFPNSFQSVYQKVVLQKALQLIIFVNTTLNKFLIENHVHITYEIYNITLFVHFSFLIFRFREDKKKISNVNNEKVFSFEKIEKPFRIISGIAISSRIRARREHSRFQRKVPGCPTSLAQPVHCEQGSSTTGYLQSAVYSLFLL